MLDRNEHGALVIERSRTKTLLDGVVVELDGVHVRIEDWPQVVEEDPSFAAWRLLVFPGSGWLTALEPADLALIRYRESLVPACSL